MNIQELEKQIVGKLSNELPKELTYHNVQHTLDVLRVCREYVKRMNLNTHDAYLLETAAIMHDTGYIWHVKNHEEHSMDYTRKLLPEWGYSRGDIAIISNIIRATKIPQKATTLLEKIIADADLDYLGTDKFYEIGERLYQELVNLNQISTQGEWIELQIRFLEKHRYHTNFARENREPLKQKHLKELQQKQS